MIFANTAGDTAQKTESKKHPYSYFILNVSQNGGELLAHSNGREQFSALLNKLAFGMNDYVSATTSNNDTVYVSDYVMPRIFGMAPTTDIQFAFKSEKIEKADWIDLRVKDFGLGVTTQKFRFNIKDLKRADNIILK